MVNIIIIQSAWTHRLLFGVWKIIMNLEKGVFHWLFTSGPKSYKAVYDKSYKIQHKTGSI